MGDSLGGTGKTGVAMDKFAVLICSNPENIVGGEKRMFSKQTMNRTLYKLLGLAMSLYAYDYVSTTSSSPYLGLLGLVSVLAFWAGTLKVNVKGIFKHEE